MKKLMIASAIAMTMTAGSAMAALGDKGSHGEVQFVGTVAAATCDIVVNEGGVVSDLIQFGTVNKGATSEKNFSVKFADPTCADALTKAHFQWSSPNFSTQGIENQSGSATGSWVELKAVSGTNTTTDVNAITSTNNKVTFNITTAANGFGYKAKLNAGQTAGTFETAAAYTVTYE
ncbi:TPA: hypothetical protein ACNG5Y_003056 [Escherichia coli]|nr:hypothetical protein [Escherichia coli]